MRWYWWLAMTFTWLLAALCGYSVQEFSESRNILWGALILPFFVALFLWLVYCWVLLRRIQRTLKHMADTLNPEKNN